MENYPHSPDQNPGGKQHEPDWERQTLEKLAFAALQEQKARRRWGIFFKSLAFLYVLGAFLAMANWDDSGSPEGKHTALVHVQGVIEPKGEASAEKVVSALQSAFQDKNAVGIVLRINSPGGSPVQAGIINDEIRRLRQKHGDKPLYAVIDDMCASGGYYVAVAAERIYVNKASMVGSIGVLMNGFGFTGTMDKLGVERRLLTSGDNKGFLDPFTPTDPVHKAHAEQLLAEIHQQFIAAVREGRGKRLKETPETFSGLVWTGTQSIQLGLADDYGTLDSVARDVFKAEKILDYSVKDNIAERVAKRLGASTMAAFWTGFGDTFGLRLH